MEFAAFFFDTLRLLAVFSRDSVRVLSKETIDPKTQHASTLGTVLNKEGRGFSSPEKQEEYL